MRNSEAYLADSSAWIEVLRFGARPSPLWQRMDELLGDEQVVMAGQVWLELLGAIPNEGEFQRRAAILGAVPLLPTTEACWDEAARLGSQLRRQGVTVPSTDLLIAAVAMSAGATVLHRDRHFDLIAQNSTLAVESYASAT